MVSLMDQPYIKEHDLRQHERHLQAEAAAHVNPQLGDWRDSSKMTKCIEVQKLTGCSVS